MNFDQILSLVRNILQFGGGILVSKGLISEPDMLTVVGALASIAVVGWSMLTHKPAK